MLYDQEIASERQDRKLDLKDKSDDFSKDKLIKKIANILGISFVLVATAVLASGINRNKEQRKTPDANLDNPRIDSAKTSLTIHDKTQ